MRRRQLSELNRNQHPQRFVWKWLVPLNPMVLLIIIPFFNGYNWEYTLFSDKSTGFFGFSNGDLASSTIQKFVWFLQAPNWLGYPEMLIDDRLVFVAPTWIIGDSLFLDKPRAACGQETQRRKGVHPNFTPEELANGCKIMSTTTFN